MLGDIALNCFSLKMAAVSEKLFDSFNLQNLKVVALVVSIVLTGVGKALSGTWADGLFDDLSKDFGSVPRGAILQHSFKIRNNTKDVVGLAGVRSSCGCTNAQLSKRYLQPGEETQLLVRMDSGRFRGLKTVTLYARLDRPEAQEVRIWIKANARDDIAVNPEVVDFRTVRAGEGGSTQIQVRFFGLPDAEIEKVSAASGYLTAKVTDEKRTQLECQFTVQVELNKQAPVGRWYSDIWLDTNQQASSKIRIPVRMEIVSALVASPSAIEFGVVDKGREVERRVVIRGAVPFRLVKVEGVGESVKARFSSDQAKTTHVVTLILKEPRGGAIQGNVQIFTDMAQSPVLALPIRAEVIP